MSEGKTVEMDKTMNKAKEEIPYEDLMNIAQQQANDLQKLTKVVNEVNVARAELLIQALALKGIFDEKTIGIMADNFLSALKVEPVKKEVDEKA